MLILCSHPTKLSTNVGDKLNFNICCLFPMLDYTFFFFFFLKVSKRNHNVAASTRITTSLGSQIKELELKIVIFLKYFCHLAERCTELSCLTWPRFAQIINRQLHSSVFSTRAAPVPCRCWSWSWCWHLLFMSTCCCCCCCAPHN